MSHTLRPYFTEEFNLYYLWRPEPLQNKIQLAGEFKLFTAMQERSKLLFGKHAVRREIKI